MPTMLSSNIPPQQQPDPSQTQPGPGPIIDPTATGSVKPRPATAQTPPMTPGGGGGLLSLLFGGGGAGGGGGQGGQATSSLASRLGYSTGIDDDFRSRVNKLGAIMMMMDPMTKDAGTSLLNMEQNRAQMNYNLGIQNQTAQWLTTQGMQPQEALMLARDPNALNEWYKMWKAKQYPNWQMQEIYAADGRKQHAMVDLNSGRFSMIGGEASPNMEVTDVYDPQTGMKGRGLVNKDNPNQPPIMLGGVDTGQISPEAMLQKAFIAQAGRPTQETTEAQHTGEMYSKAFADYRAGNEKAQTMMGNLDAMESLVRSPDFTSGGGADFKLNVDKLAQSMGYGDQAKDASISKRELFQSMSNRMTLDSLGGSLGVGISDEDRNTIHDTVANLDTSRGGNLANIALQRALQQRQQDIWQLALNYRKTHGHLDEGFDQQLMDWRNQHQLMTPELLQRIQTLSQSDRTGALPPAGQSGGRAVQTSQPSATGVNTTAAPPPQGYKATSVPGVFEKVGG